MVKKTKRTNTLLRRESKMKTALKSNSVICPLLSVICFLLCLFVATSAFAYSGGDGSSGNPYQIADVADLLQLSADVNDYNKCFIMTADINLAGYDFNQAVIAPSFSYSFTGKFNGAGHKIRNLDINSENGIGLFGCVGEYSEVNNIGLENFNMTGLGGGGLVSYNSGTIDNCHSTGIIIKKMGCISIIGGLVGMNGGTISNCYSEGEVNAVESYFNSDCGPNTYGIGGLVGQNGVECGYATNCGTIIQSYSASAVIGGNSSLETFGGLVGNNNYGYIIQCFSTGPIHGLDYVGGLVGIGDFINNCYSTGDVSGRYAVGGLVGAYADARNCYSTGVVTGVNWVGGLVGDGYGGTSSYFLNTSGPNNGYGTPLSDANMKHQASFVDWDFVGETANGTEDIWCIFEGRTYPRLAWYWCDSNGPGVPGEPNAPGNGKIPNYDGEGIVNFLDFAIFADAWLTENPLVSLDAYAIVDVYDLKIFCYYWLEEGP
jgi:hypothetical protein